MQLRACYEHVNLNLTLQSLSFRSLLPARMISDLALESQEVALLVISFLITLVVIYIVYRRTSTLHQERAHSGSTPSPLSTPKVFANDPNKDRELGSQYFCSWTSYFDCDN